MIKLVTFILVALVGVGILGQMNLPLYPAFALACLSAIVIK